MVALLNRKNLIRLIGVIIIILLGLGGKAWLSKIEKTSQKREIEPTLRMVKTQIFPSTTTTLTISGNGLIRSENTLEITAAVNGKITWMKPDLKKGTMVTRGETLLTIDSRQARNKLYLGQASLIKSVVSLLPDLFSSSDRKVYDKWKAYLERLNLEDHTPPLPPVESLNEKTRMSIHDVFANYYQVKNAEIALSEHTVRAPFSGTITDGALQRDGYVSVGQKLLTIMDPVNLEISVPITLTEFRQLDLAQRPEVTVRYEDGPRVSLRGHIVRSDSQIDEGTQSVSVHVAFKNSSLHPEFYPGNYVNLLMEGQTLTDILLIPRYLIRDDTHLFALEGDKLARKPVTILAIQEDIAIVKNTLPTKTEVITTILQKPIIGMQLARISQPQPELPDGLTTLDPEMQAQQNRNP